MAKKKAKSSEITSVITLEKTVNEFCEHLEAKGKSQSTQNTYTLDLGIALKFFGGDKDVASIRPANVGRFFKSDDVNKLKSGKDRALPTVLKTKRVFRQLMVLCAERGYIDPDIS